MIRGREMPFDPTKTMEDINPPQFEDEQDVQKDKAGTRIKVETKHDEEDEKRFNIKEIVETTVQNAVQKAFSGFIDGTYTLDDMRKSDILQVIKQDVISKILKIHPDKSSTQERKKLQKKLIEEPAEDPELAEKQWEEQFTAVDQLTEMEMDDQKIKTRIEGWVTLHAIDQEIERQAPEAEKKAKTEEVKKKLAEMKTKKQEKVKKQEKADQQKIDDLKVKLGIKKRETDGHPTENNKKAA